jgi:hypothetical protein
MARAVEAPEEWRYALGFHTQTTHKGIVKGNRMRVNAL